MGWTFTHKQKGLSVKDFFQSRFGDVCDILECRTKHFSECYMAIRQKATGKVFGMVCLIQYQNDFYNFGYKDMDEECGPCYWDCPESILKRLTPTNSEYANNWREGCWENVARRNRAKKVKNGDTIVFKNSITFTNGDKLSDFQVVSKKRNAFSRNSWQYRIKGWKDMDYEIVSV